jgi:hypothetical protein
MQRSMKGVISVTPVKEGTMQIASRTVRIPSVPATRRTRVAVATCAAALAAGGIAFVAQPADQPAAVTLPAAPAASGGDDLSRYDGALLHHHGIRVARSSVTIPPTTAQRRAADRFHHR